MKSLRRYIMGIVAFWITVAAVGVVGMLIFHTYDLRYKEHERTSRIVLKMLKNTIESDRLRIPVIADIVMSAFTRGATIALNDVEWYVVTHDDVVLSSTSKYLRAGGIFSPVIAWKDENTGCGVVPIHGREKFVHAVRKNGLTIYMVRDFEKYESVVTKESQVFIVSPTGEIVAGDDDYVGLSVASLGLDLKKLKDALKEHELRTNGLDVLVEGLESGFYIIAVYDRISVMKKIMASMIPYAFFFGIVAFFLSSFLLETITSRIMKPIDKMVHDITSGNLPIDTEYEEFNRISDALEELIIRLKSIYQGLRFTASLEFEVDLEDPQIELSVMKKFELSLPMIFKKYRAVAYYSVVDETLRMESMGGHSEEITAFLEKLGGERIDRGTVESLLNENPLTAVWLNFSDGKVLLMIPVYIDKVLKYVVFIKLDEFSGRTEVEAGEILVLEYNLVLEQINILRKLNRLATTDFLTGLKNRMYFMNRLEEECERMKRYGTGQKSFGVSMLDLDGLKKVNDTYGHEVGDEYIKTFADYIKRMIRRSDVAGRLGGDEFGIIWMNVTWDELKAAERRLVEGLKNLYTPKTGIKVSASVGSALYGRDGTTPDELINKADMRMYTMKSMKKVRRR